MTHPKNGDTMPNQPTLPAVCHHEDGTEHPLVPDAEGFVTFDPSCGARFRSRMMVAAVTDDLRAKIEALARVLYLADYPDVPEAAEWWDLPRENPKGFDHGSWVVQAATALAWLAARPVQVTTAEELDALPVAWVIEYDEHPTHPGSHVGPFQTPTAADAWAATFARPGWRASYIVAPLYRPDRPEVTP